MPTGSIFRIVAVLITVAMGANVVAAQITDEEVEAKKQAQALERLASSHESSRVRTLAAARRTKDLKTALDRLTAQAAS